MKVVSSYTEYVLIALSCDHFSLHVSLLKSVREKLVAFPSPCIAVMVQSRCQGITMTCGGMKNSNTTDRCSRRKKKHW